MDPSSETLRWYSWEHKDVKAPVIIHSHSHPARWESLSPCHRGGNWRLAEIQILPAVHSPGDLEYLNPVLSDSETIPGADYGLDHELFIAKFRLKLKKVRQTTRPFRYDLNQISYDYTVEVMNRFKGSDLIECVKNYGWRFVTMYRDQCKEIEENNRMGKTRDLFKKIRDTKGTFHAKMGWIKEIE